jgi:hypothetical protein
MPNIDRIIDAEIYHLRLIGCVVNIVDDEALNEPEEEYNF